MTFSQTVRLVVLCKSKKGGLFVCRHWQTNDILRACYVTESGVFHTCVCATCGWLGLCEVIRRRWQVRFVLWRNVWRGQHCCVTGNRRNSLYQFIHCLCVFVSTCAHIYNTCKITHISDTLICLNIFFSFLTFWINISVRKAMKVCKTEVNLSCKLWQ